MAWSAKLISGDGGIQGVNEWEMVYDAASQTDLKLLYNFSMGDEAPDVLYYTPDNGSPMPVRANDKNKLIFLKMHVTSQSNWDDVINAMVAIDRLVDGSSSQAVRYWTSGDVDKVKVAITPDGATYATYYDVLHGFVDKSTAYTQPVSILNKMAYEVTIALTCAPLGYGDSFTLFNELASSPHILEDSNSDGLADGWTKLNAPTAGISTSVYLIGGKSQYFTTVGAGFEGLFTQTTSTYAQGTNAVGYLWVRANVPGADNLVIALTDGANILQSKTFDPSSPANYDKTAIGSDGGTWYRYSVTGARIAAGSGAFFIQARRASGTSYTYYLDGAYLETGTTTAPPAFASANVIKNRYDPAVATTNINYLDVWGIPGDAPAFIKTSITPTTLTNNIYKIIATKRFEGVQKLSDYNQGGGSGTVTTGTGTWTSPTGSTWGGSYRRYTEAVGGAGNGTITFTQTASTSNDLWSVPRRIFVLARSSNSATTINFNTTLLGSSIDGDAISFTNANTWELLDLGVVDNSSLLSMVIGGELAYSFIVTTPAGLVTVDIDEPLLIPAQDDGFIIANHTPSPIATTATSNIDGQYEFVYKTGQTAGASHLGEMFTISTGMASRLSFYLVGNNNAYTVGDTSTASLTITPRTRHLLGTI